MPKKTSKHQDMKKEQKNKHNFISTSLAVDAKVPSQGSKPDPPKSEDLVLESVPISESKKYNKRSIQSNWDKYNMPLHDVDQEEEVNDTADFSFVLSHSSTDSSHFQLAEEKEWEKLQVNNDESIFQLDLRILTAGLKCIPFYDRIGAQTNRLTKEDIERCDYHSEKNWIQFDILIREINKASKKENIPDPNRSFTVKEEKTVEFNQTVSELKNVGNKEDVSLSGCANRASDSQDDFVRSLQTALVEESQQNRAEISVKADGDDLEDWLDGVLDD